MSPAPDPKLDAVFEELIAPAVVREGARWPRHGTLLFVVGPEAWTVRLGDSDSPVERGSHGEADLVISLSERALSGLLEGTLDLDEAITSRGVGYRGDLGLLESLGRMLAGAQRPHDVRGGA